VDNRGISDLFGQIADLLEVKGENAFKIRAYRTAADTIGAWPDPVGRMGDAQLRAIPGIGKDLAAKLLEIAATGACAYHQELLAEFPLSVLDLLRLQGVGPKTVALFINELNVRSVDELATAVKAGRLRSIKGMGQKKEALLLKAIEERSRDAGRHLLAHTSALADELVAYLQSECGDVDLVPVGSLRRGSETCGDLDILAVGGTSRLMDVFVNHPKVERVLGHGETKSSVRLHGGYQADLRLVPSESRGRPCSTSPVPRPTTSRCGIGRSGWIPAQRVRSVPEVGQRRRGRDRRSRDLRGAWLRVGSAGTARGPRRVRCGRRTPAAGAHPGVGYPRRPAHAHHGLGRPRHDRGDGCRRPRPGYQYIAITDHSKALAVANGLDERRALEHAALVRSFNGRFEGLTLLAGIECDILEDGSLDLADDCLAQLDLVIASIHSRFNQDAARMTDRVVKALESPYVDILAHPTGRRLLQRTQCSCTSIRSPRPPRPITWRSKSIRKSTAWISTTSWPGRRANAAPRWFSQPTHTQWPN
jgi:DNA polymerase (family 10)